LPPKEGAGAGDLVRRVDILVRGTGRKEPSDVGADALGTRGDIERHCSTSIGKIDGWVAGPLALDGEPRNQPEWRL
jgi:hypothetical protein